MAKSSNVSSSSGGGVVQVFSASSARLADCRAAKAELSMRLLRSPERAAAAMAGVRALSIAKTPTPDRNVVGVGIGERLADGKGTGEMALKLFVRIKLPESQLARSDLLPKSA